MNAVLDYIYRDLSARARALLGDTVRARVVPVATAFDGRLGARAEMISTALRAGETALAYETAKSLFFDLLEAFTK